MGHGMRKTPRAWARNSAPDTGADRITLVDLRPGTGKLPGLFNTPAPRIPARQTSVPSDNIILHPPWG